MTYNSVLAFAECGLVQADVHYEGTTAEVPTSQLKVERITGQLKAEDILRRLVEKKDWVDDALHSSEHGPLPDDKDKRLSPRASIVLGRMAPAVGALVRHVDFFVLKDLQASLVSGLARIAERLTNDVFTNPVELFADQTAGRRAMLSPQIVLSAATAIKHWEALMSFLVDREKNLSDDEQVKYGIYFTKHTGTQTFEQTLDAAITTYMRKQIREMLEVFRAYFSRQVDRQMARKHVKLDPD